MGNCFIYRTHKKGEERKFYAEFSNLESTFFYIYNLDAYKWEIKLYGGAIVKRKKIKPMYNLVIIDESSTQSKKIYYPALVKYVMNIKMLIK